MFDCGTTAGQRLDDESTKDFLHCNDDVDMLYG